MKISTIPMSACAGLILAGCAGDDYGVKTNEFVGEWRTSVQCLDHEREPGHAGQADKQIHLEGTYSIAERGERFVLQPLSGAFKDEFSDCELMYDPGKGRIANGAGFNCDTFNPGAGAMHLSGTCDLTHSGRPTPHNVQIFMIEKSPLYNGGKNPVIQFAHPGPAHGGWLH